MSGISEACIWRTIERHDPFHIGIYCGGAALNLMLAAAGVERLPTSDVDVCLPQAVAAPLQDLPGAQLLREQDYPEFTVRVPANEAAGTARLDATGDDAFYSTHMGWHDRLVTVTSPSGRQVTCLGLEDILFGSRKDDRSLLRAEHAAEALYKAGLVDEASFERIIDEYFRLLEVKILTSHDKIAPSRREYGIA